MVEVNAVSPRAQAVVQALTHQELAVAEQIHAVMMFAYAQEAALLKVKHFVPLERAVSDVQASSDFFLGAFVEGELLAAIGIGPDDEPDQLCINSLVVHPKAQRQGMGRLLVATALQRGAGEVFAVATAALNAPALALYRAFGFVEYRWGEIGAERLGLVKLRRSGVQPISRPD
jgi:ribosomal protein S18 acetylase RimI-like enzyme